MVAMRGVCGVLAGVLAACALSSLGPTAGAGPGVSVANDCVWTEFTRFPGVSTTPDTNTQVYQAVYSASPVHETFVTGHPPHARFWSLAIVDQANRELDNVSDSEITYDPLLGAQTYQVVVRTDCAGVPNCLSVASAPAPVAPGRLFYRIYVPEGDGAGGVPLPSIGYHLLPGGDVIVAAGAEPTGVCSMASDNLAAPIRPGGAAAEALAGPSGFEQPVATPGEDPQPRRFDGLGGEQVEQLADAGVPPEVIATLEDARGQGGFGATEDNAYLTMRYSQRMGNVVVRAKGPTFRSQQNAGHPLARADGSEQVRYWSLCTTQGTRPVDCLRDENVAVGADGYFEIVIAPGCPVAGFANCMRGGVTTNLSNGNLLYRNLLARAEFANADGPHVCPDPPSQFCGEYALTAHYIAR